jgi:hypothetical protein
MSIQNVPPARLEREPRAMLFPAADLARDRCASSYVPSRADCRWLVSGCLCREVGSSPGIRDRRLAW